MRILSISDVITNSSSEVFIIHGKPEFQDELNEEIPELLEALCDSIGLNVDDMMYFEVSNSTYIDEDWEYPVENNDLIIHSQSDNTIPSWLMEFIEYLYNFPKFQNKFFGYYAEDLGEKELPRYNWNKRKYEKRKKEIESIQRHHLG